MIFVISLLTRLCWTGLVDHFKVHWSASNDWRTSKAKRLQSRKNIFTCCNTIQWCISISQQWFLILIYKFRLKIRWKLLITMQGSLEVNPSVLFGSFLVAILLYRQLPWKQRIIRYLNLFQNTQDSHVYQVDSDCCLFSSMLTVLINRTILRAWTLAERSASQIKTNTHYTASNRFIFTSNR